MRTADQVVAEMLALPRRREPHGAPSTSGLFLERLKLEEGVVDYPYDDANGTKVSAPQGVITWGVGFTWPMGEHVIDTVLAMKVSQHNGELEDLLQRELELKVYGWYALPVPAYLALQDCAYNLGVPRLSKFRKTLAAVKTGDWRGAARELMDSRYARQVPARAGRNAKLLEAGFE